jgi:TonB family protein
MPLQMPSPGVDVLDSLAKEGVTSNRELKVFDGGRCDPEDNKPPDNPSPTPELDEKAVLSELGELISSGTYELDAILHRISDAALKLSQATGSAIAMWKDGAVVCRASCGEGAPPLGAHLSVESGISGHCLRSGLAQHCGETETDPRVDAELCRQLGLRSVAVLPIRGWRGVNGILEVFSTEPRAFREQHFELLEQLAGLAERARAGHPSLESDSAVTPLEELTKSRPLLPASDRLRDLAAVLLSAKKRPLVLAVAAVIGLLLIGFVIWLGWRNPDSVKAKGNTSTPAPGLTQAVSFKGSDPVWQPNPGGERSFPSAAGGSSARVGSKDEIAPNRSQQDRPGTSSSDGDTGAPEIVKRYRNSDVPASSPDSAVEGPPVVSAALNPAALDNVLSAPNPEPKLAAVPISQGVSNGHLIRRVAPVYPQQARMTRIEGDVVLDALIAEDGTVRDVKVVRGQPTLARAAVQAVRQWRYQPYELNRKPVRMNTTITVSFKLP